MIEGHEKVGFAFSGGKDSLAALYFLRRFWPVMTVYWVDTGDSVPEVREVVERVRAEVPNFKVVRGRQPETIASFGWPADTVPADTEFMGAVALGSKFMLQSRNQCCFQSLMLPLHKAMEEDGVTLLIRGQKNSDKRKAPVQSGDRAGSATLWFPISDWTDEQVFEFLVKEGVPVPEYYSQLKSSPDCLTCSAYLDEERGAFLRTRHPEAWDTVRFRVKLISAALRESQAELTKFLEK